MRITWNGLIIYVQSSKSDQLMDKLERVIWFRWLEWKKKRGWGKPKITLVEVINKDMLIKEIMKYDFGIW